MCLGLAQGFIKKPEHKDKVFLKRWNYSENKYMPYMVPDDWNVGFYEEDLDKKCNCACCGKLDKYGNMFSSMEIHNDVGYGYMVCRNCSDAELQRRSDYAKGVKNGRSHK